MMTTNKKPKERKTGVTAEEKLNAYGHVVCSADVHDLAKFPSKFFLSNFLIAHLFMSTNWGM